MQWKRTYERWIITTFMVFIIVIMLNVVFFANLLNIQLEVSDQQSINNPETRQRSAKFNVLKVQEEEIPKSDNINIMETCINSMPIEQNNADIQVSHLVDELDFHLDHGGRLASSFPRLEPLPFTEPLKVLLIPHSHCDPGWLLSYRQYYERDVRPLLNNLYRFATSHPDFKYIYAEVSFFSFWWEEQGETVREGMRDLARQARFEFVQGGWVQTDEANTHYFAMLNEMLDGHDWLKENFPEAVPRTGWAIDPFGLSPVMAYVNKMFGLTAMHIQRVHYSVKNHLAEQRKLDFIWRQSWDTKGDLDMLTHLGPFASYAAQHTCGPDPKVCCQFNFADYKTKKGYPKCKVLMGETQIETKALKILDQWRKKAALHSMNTIFIELGEDFAYSANQQVDYLYDNYKAIMEYINNDPSLNTNVSWATLSEYFDIVRAEQAHTTLPSLSGDFFTYADRQTDYWSGYYTSRPFYKNLDRVLESALRRTEILYAFNPAPSAKESLVESRNTLSLFQHHDAITGTSKPVVVVDYGQRLLKAYKACVRLSLDIMQSLLSTPTPFRPVADRRNFDTVEKLVPLEGPGYIALFSSLPRDVKTVATFAVRESGTHFELDLREAQNSISRSKGLKLVTKEGGEVEQQVEPHFEHDQLSAKNVHQIAFVANSRSVSIESYRLDPGPVNPVTVDVYNAQPSAWLKEKYICRTHDTALCTDIRLGTERNRLTLDCKTGRLIAIERGGKKVEISQELLMYTGKSGVYLFEPKGLPEHIFPSTVEIRVIRGSVRQKAIVTVSSDFTITYTINLIPGHDGEFVDINILSNLKQKGDLTLRFATSVKSGDSIFTDLNGHTIQQHKYKEKLRIQGNFFPMPSMAFIQDASTRFSILSSEPHGVASLKEGELEVMLDRRPPTNDDKGLGQGVDDNVPTPMTLRLLLEERSEGEGVEEKSEGEGVEQRSEGEGVKEKSEGEGVEEKSEGDEAERRKTGKGYVVEYPSLLSHLSQQTLLHAPFLGYSNNTTPAASRQLFSSLPCDEELVNLRHVRARTSLLIRRKLGFSCNIKSPGTVGRCVPHVKDIVGLFKVPVTVHSHPFSPFHDPNKDSITATDIRPMEFTSDYVEFTDL